MFKLFFSHSDLCWTLYFTDCTNHGWHEFCYFKGELSKVIIKTNFKCKLQLSGALFEFYLIYFVWTLFNQNEISIDLKSIFLVFFIFYGFAWFFKRFTVLIEMNLWLVAICYKVFNSFFHQRIIYQSFGLIRMLQSRFFCLFFIFFGDFSIEISSKVLFVQN